MARLKAPTAVIRLTATVEDGDPIEVGTLAVPMELTLSGDEVIATVDTRQLRQLLGGLTQAVVNVVDGDDAQRVPVFRG